MILLRARQYRHQSTIQQLLYGLQIFPDRPWLAWKHPCEEFGMEASVCGICQTANALKSRCSTCSMVTTLRMLEKPPGVRACLFRLSTMTCAASMYTCFPVAYA